MNVMLYVSKRCKKFFVEDVVKCVLLLIVAVVGIWGVETYSNVDTRSLIMIPVALGVAFVAKMIRVVSDYRRGHYY